MREPSSKAIAYSNWLGGLAASENRGLLAALRRGLMYENECLFELYAYIPPSFLAGMRSSWEEHVYLIIASLYAFHSVNYSTEELNIRRRNLGESLRKFALVKNASQSEGDEELKKEIPDTVKRRFGILLGSPRTELFGHLRQIISLIKSEDIPIDWALLLCDLLEWEWKGNPVQWRWSKSFYIGYQDEMKGDSDNVS